MEQNIELVVLADEDKKILEDFRESGYPGLAPSTAAAFFSLFLNGSSVREIQRLNPAFKLGAILDARVRYNWDIERDRYVRELQSQAISRLVQIQLESAAFLADSLSAAHKKYGTAIKKFLQTGNEDDLQGFDIGNITSYTKTIEGLLKITGQDSKKVKVEGQVTQNHTGSVKVDNLMDKAVSPETAEKLLQILSEDESR